MIGLTVANEARTELGSLCVSDELAQTAVNNRHRGLADHGVTRVAAVHWLDEQRIIFVDTQITKRQIEAENKRFKVEEVKANVAIELRPELPAGAIGRDMDMESILAIIAESFGQPLRCHPEAPYSTLYSGPCAFGQNNAVGIEIKQPSGDGSIVAIGVTGSFSPDRQWADLVWAFNADRYRKWAETALTGG
jgi:hypothetical protein